MDEKNLLICDTEVQYANALGENMIQREDLVFRVHVCTNLDHVLQFCKKQEIHVLVIADSFSLEERRSVGAQHVFVLTEETCDDLAAEEVEIFKYQSADDILGEILEKFYEKTHSIITKKVHKSRQKILAVYSPIHRIGKTTFALELGKELAKIKRTLYVNMEDYADIGGRFAYSEKRNLGDLVYYMRQDEKNLVARLSTMTLKVDELDYIPPILYNSDLKEITYEEWKQLLDIIANESNYEVLVLDLSESVQGLMNILQMADVIYMPVLEDMISTKKITRYEEELNRMHQEEIKMKVRKILSTEDMSAYVRKLVEEEE